MKVKKCILYQWNVNIIQIHILSLFTFTWWGWTFSPFYVRSHADRWKKQWKRLRAHAFPLTDLDANIVTGGCRARRPFTPVGPVRVDLRNKTKKTLAHSYVKISGGPLSALTCCVNVRLLSAIKKISPLIYSQSWVGSWVYTTQAMMTFTLIF